MSTARRVDIVRAMLSAAAVAGTLLVFVALAGVHSRYGPPVAALASAAMLWWWRGVFARRSVRLWLEERVPEMRYALVALADAPDTPFRPELEARVRDVRFRSALGAAILKLVGVPLALLLAMQLVGRPLIERVVSMPRESAGGGARNPIAAALTRRAFSAVVTPPAYSGFRPQTLENPTGVAALVGSGIRFTSRGAVLGETTMPAAPTVYRLGRGSSERVVALEPRVDSVPRVVLELPARDTVLPVANGAIPLVADARDDIGIVAGWFEIIVSSGNGENFKFRSAVLGRAMAGNARSLRLESRLRLDSLGLEPGDVVHLRAVARDANPQPGAEAGSSETRTFRVFRRDESDSVAIEAALPPDVGKGEVSQRMLIIMTEELIAKRLARPATLEGSRSIATDQSRLRKRVGQIIFTRLTGEEATDEEARDALADTVSPADALLKAASDATGAGAGASLEEEEGEEGGPVVGINRPLLEAFNAMWEAERRLGIGEPRQALPHMRAALAAIQRARAAERIYLRGRPPKVVLDIQRIRLTGKRDAIDPGARSARGSAVAGTLAQRERFHRALALLSDTTRGAAAIDTLLVLRIDALSGNAPLAAALDAAIGDLRAGRNATRSLQAARAALLRDVESRRTDGRWSGAW